MILITGATGRVGSEVVRALAADGVPVRAFVRDADRAVAAFGPDVDVVVGDFADRASVRSALAGIDALLLSCADDPRRVDWERGAIDEAVVAGVGRVVKLSTIGASPDAPVAFWQWHGLVEDYLRVAGAPSVVLRSSFYMSNLLDGPPIASGGTAQIAMVDPRDVGAAAAKALQGVGEDGETYTLTGPQAEPVDLPDEGEQARLVAAGVPAFVADQLIAMAHELRAGVASDVTSDVETLTGRRPFSLAEFARQAAPTI
jgi:uncharacterized protein YbjT (DUF2867 family)